MKRSWLNGASVDKIFHLLLVILLLCGSTATVACMSIEEKNSLRGQVIEMFDHGFNNYMKYAFPRDELKPLSCSGMNTWGNYSLTLIDSLDTLYVLGRMDDFRAGANYVANNLNYDEHHGDSVSLFETNIRVLGGLISTHLLLTPKFNYLTVDEEQKELDAKLAQTILKLARDLGDRLVVAFDTPTGIPYGSVNLVHGVAKDESNITSVAGAGTYLMEFGVLSVLTGDCKYMRAAERALSSLFNKRSSGFDLLGNHINILSGQWTHRDAGIGANVDSIYEYMWKGHVLFGLEKLSQMFDVLYDGVMRNIYRDPWYFEVDMFTGTVTWPLFNSLQAFWPGLQATMGRDIQRAVNTVKAFHGVWRRYGCLPEGWNVNAAAPQPKQRLYPLRPELPESIYHLYRATKDPLYLYMARDIVKSLFVVAKAKCGYATVADVESHALEDRMESFFLSETLKYLYLIFTDDHYIHKTSWTFTTEAHLVPLDPLFLHHECVQSSPLQGTPVENSQKIVYTDSCKLSERSYISPFQFGVCQLSFGHSD